MKQGKPWAPEVVQAFIDGKITHFIIHNEIKTYREVVQHFGKNQSTLLSLKLNKDGSVIWTIRNVPGAIVLPCTSYEEAVKFMQDRLDSLIKRGAAPQLVLRLAQVNNLALPDGYGDEQALILQTQKEAKIKKLEEKLNRLKGAEHD